MSKISINQISDSFSSNPDINSKIPLKEEFFMSDFEKYYKYGKFPYLFFFHVILVILSTLVITNRIEELSFLRYTLRNLESTFIKDSSIPDLDRAQLYLIESIPQLNDHLDLVLQQIYNYKNSTIKEIVPINFNQLEMKIRYRNLIFDDKLIRKFEIKSVDDNPFRKMNNTEIRKFLSEVESFGIKLEYLISFDPNSDKTLKLRWETEVHYGIGIRGRIKFRLHNFAEKYKEHPYFYIYIWEELKSGLGLMYVCIMILAFCQAMIVVYRLYYGYKCLMLVKKQLEDDEEAFGIKSIKSGKEIVSSGDVDSIYVKGKTKWEMLKMNEKRNFFNLWYILMLVTNFVQILSALNHLVFPVLSNKHEFYCSLSCLLTYISCGYFFEYEEKYYFFYLTMKKSFKTHFKYLCVFCILFIGLGLFLFCTFHYSEKFYSNVHMTFITMFASIFGDTLLDIWTSTLENNPLITIICALFFFLVFIAFLLKMLVTITEESFDCIRMRKNYYWLDQKLSVKDYIKNEIVLKDDDDREKKEGQHYMMSDIVLNIILNANNLVETVDKLNIDNAIQIDVKKLESEGILNDDIVKIIKKEFRKSLKNESLKEVEHLSLFEEHFETQTIKGVYKTIDNIFDKIMSSLDKIDLIIKNELDLKDLDKRDLNKIFDRAIGYSDKISYNLNDFKKILNN